MIVPSTIAASVKRSMEVSSWPVAPFSLLSLGVVWSLTGNPPCDHVRVRHCCVYRNPPQRSLSGVFRARGIKYNWFNVVLSFFGAYPVSDFLRSALRGRSSLMRDSGKSRDSCAK